MSKHKIVIDLRRLKLSDEQHKDLNNALHKAVVNQLKKSGRASASTDKADRAGSKKLLKTFEAETAESRTASLNATFINTNPGKSSLKAVLNEEEKTIDRSGIITFTNVHSGDIIIIQGESLGTTTVTIDISADPTQMNFSPGHFNDNFFIN